MEKTQKKNPNKKQKKTTQNIFLYRLVQFLAWFVAIFAFRRKFLRNEIKGKKGPAHIEFASV